MENDYRKKLQERTFEPSKDSWKTLDEKLTAFENKRKVKKWVFLKYAATILILISVGLYFNQEEEKIDAIIVEQPVIKIEELKNDFNNVESKEVVAEVIEENIEKPSIKKNLVVKTSKQRSKNKLETNEEVQKNLINPKEGVIGISSNFKMDTIQTKTIEEFIVLAQAIEKKNGEVSDLEIDQLLEQAHNSLKAERNVIHTQVFKGSDLLAEIEYDLDKDFKARLFEAIVNTLKDPKKVFVNRDN